MDPEFTFWSNHLNTLLNQLQHWLTQNDKLFHEHRSKLYKQFIYLFYQPFSIKSNGKSLDGIIFIFCIFWSNRKRSRIICVSDLRNRWENNANMCIDFTNH